MHGRASRHGSAAPAQDVHGIASTPPANRPAGHPATGAAAGAGGGGHDPVSVGNPGNAADPTTGFGRVTDAFQIGNHEVTLGEYTAFLNAVAADDLNAPYDPALRAEPREPQHGPAAHLLPADGERVAQGRLLLAGPRGTGGDRLLGVCDAERLGAHQPAARLGPGGQRQLPRRADLLRHAEQHLQAGPELHHSFRRLRRMSALREWCIFQLQVRTRAKAASPAGP